MKKILSLLLLSTLAAASASARAIISRQLPIENVTVTNTIETLTLNIDFKVDSLRQNADTEYAVTPVMVSTDGTDSVAFAPFIIAGRNLYYRHLRLDNTADTTMYRAGSQRVLPYTNTIGRSEWMDNADIYIRTVKTGCCRTPRETYIDSLARVRRPVYRPVFSYVVPLTDSVKEFKLEGSADINFPVNRTELFPDYMNNPRELARITGTIDSVKGDPDITITYIFIKGFASPEGSYANNVRLAKGRTATLTEYVERISHLPQGFIDTDYLPEDWPGLRSYVKSSALTSRDAILELIDSDMEPDAKDHKLKADFPEQYKFLLAQVYPSLRHSDYLIRYTVRSYTTLEEILRVLHTQPQKLSTAEFYRAALSMQEGSPEYNEVFETAVRMYPDDPVSNLNAANTAMKRGDYDAAARYLDKAGDSGVAVYARGILAALRTDYPAAEAYFTEAAGMGVAEAAQALDEIRLVQKYANGRVELIDPDAAPAAE